MKPEYTPWPSVADDAEDCCPYCEARLLERHQPACPMYEPAFDELCQCDRCGVEFFSNCLCDAHCPEDER